MIRYDLLSVFLVGWLGGVHCLGMCGGLVSAMSLSTPGRRAEWPVLLGYNLGRLASYTLAGALAGLVGAGSLLLGHLLPISLVLYGLANVMLILLGLYLAGWSQAVLQVERMGDGLWRGLRPLMSRFLPPRHYWQALPAGLIWGWLPCGLVYSVLLTALASGSAGRGALVMLAFGLGTLPNLLAMGWFAQRLQGVRRQAWVRRAAGLLVVGFGVIGLWRVVHLVAGGGRW